MSSALHQFLAWLAQQGHILLAVLGGVASDKVMPAQQVAAYTALMVAVLLLFVAPRLIKKLKK
jgi:hypothetical protein